MKACTNHAMPVSPETTTNSSTPAEGASEGQHASEDLIDAEATQEEEVQPQRTLKAPEAPTKQEMEEHRMSGHAQYRLVSRLC